jgi:DNA-binding cell septation regulator SpoVG
MSNPYLAKMSVLRIIPANKGNVKAFASVRLGEALTIHSIKVIQQAGQKAYVRLPEQEQGGKYFPVVSANDQRFQDAVQELVLAAWRDGVVTGANGNGE